MRQCIRVHTALQFVCQPTFSSSHLQASKGLRAGYTTRKFKYEASCNTYIHHATVFLECEGGFKMILASPFPVENKGYVVKRKKNWRAAKCTVQST